MSCNNPARELLEAYALGVLDADEQARVERHLASCGECQRLAREYAEAASSLPHALASASKLSPPPEIKTRLLQSLATMTSRSRSREPAQSDLLAKRTPTAGWRWRTAAVFGLSILLALSLAWGLQLNVALAQERAWRAELANMIGQQEVVLEIVDSREATKAFLRPVESGSSSYGKLWTHPDFPDVVAMAGRLPPPPAEQAYHLWVTHAGQTRLAGVMTVNDQGFGLLIFQDDHPGPVYDAAQLSLQPLGTYTPGGATILAWTASP